MGRRAKRSITSPGRRTPRCRRGTRPDRTPSPRTVRSRPGASGAYYCDAADKFNAALLPNCPRRLTNGKAIAYNRVLMRCRWELSLSSSRIHRCN